MKSDAPYGLATHIDMGGGPTRNSLRWVASPPIHGFPAHNDMGRQPIYLWARNPHLLRKKNQKEFLKEAHRRSLGGTSLRSARSSPLRGLAHKPFDHSQGGGRSCLWLSSAVPLLFLERRVVCAKQEPVILRSTDPS